MFAVRTTLKVCPTSTSVGRSALAVQLVSSVVTATFLTGVCMVYAVPIIWKSSQLPITISPVAVAPSSEIVKFLITAL